jgi:hypothetical protein
MALACWKGPLAMSEGLRCEMLSRKEGTLWPVVRKSSNLGGELVCFDDEDGWWSGVGDEVHEANGVLEGVLAE